MAIHILQFFSTLNNGGAENRIMDVYNCIDNKQIIFDFAVVHPGKHYFDDEIQKKGSEKYVLPDPKKGLIRNYISLIRLFNGDVKFQAVHTHVSWYGGVVLMAAWQAGVKIRIAHARGAGKNKQSIKDRLFLVAGKFLIRLFATQKMAISREAALNLFGNNAVRKHQYVYVPNAVNQHKYVVLNYTDRNKLREKLGISVSKKAYVYVANLRSVKNHLFLLDIANELKRKNDDFELYLIGEGDQRALIEKKISEFGLQDAVFLMGIRNDVPDILSVFDCMIFPSRSEGLGGAILEAQLVGVPAVVSDIIPEEADVGINMVEYVSLSDSPEVWADAVINKTGNHQWNYSETLEAFRKKGYIIEETAKLYLKEYGIDDAVIQSAVRGCD